MVIANEIENKNNVIKNFKSYIMKEHVYAKIDNALPTGT